MKHTTLSIIEINPSKPPIGSIIWLHGLGADGNDFVPLVPELKLPDDLSLRFIFPNAPVRPVSISNGYEMRAWYDILSLQIDGEIDDEGIQKSAKHIGEIIAHEQHMGISTDKIVLAGFSQGAAMALTTGIAYPKSLAGIIALSGYFPSAERVFSERSIDNQTLPVFLGHGTEDPIVPFFLGQHARETLEEKNYPVTWKNYPMAHSVCEQEFRDITEWLEKIYLNG